MKKNKFLSVLIALFAFTFYSCSSDDSSSSSNNNTDFTLPLSTGNYWVYDVQSNAGTTRDSLYIANDTVISGNTYKKFKTLEIPTGFYSSSLNENGARQTNNKTMVSGSLSLGAAQGLPTDFSISIADFVIFDASASSGDELDSYSGSFNEVYNGFTLNFNYTLKATAGDYYETFSTNNTSYNDVKSTIITLNLTVSNVVVGTIIENQEIINSEQFFANEIGVVNTQTTFSYTINPIIANQLGIPASETRNQEEFLVHYSVD